MALQITSATPDEVTLTPATAPLGCIRWLVGGFGALGLLVGGGLLATRYPVGVDFTNLPATAFAVLGGGFTVLAFFIGGPAPLGLATLGGGTKTCPRSVEPLSAENDTVATRPRPASVQRRTVRNGSADLDPGTSVVVPPDGSVGRAS